MTSEKLYNKTRGLPSAEEIRAFVQKEYDDNDTETPDYSAALNMVLDFIDGKIEGK